MNSKSISTRSQTLALLAAGLWSLILLPIGCGKKEVSQVAETIRPVKIQELRSGGLLRMVELPGQILPAAQADMAFEVPGFMTEVLVEEGQEIKAGHVLAKLDPRDYEANKVAASAQLQAAEEEASRSQSLYDQNATSLQRLESARANLSVAQSNFDRAEKAVEDTVLRAPIDGVVAKILVDDLGNIQAKQTIVIIQNISSFKVAVDVPETLPVLSKPGMKIEEKNEHVKPMVYLTALSDRAFPARIVEVSSMADPITRTFSATFEMEAPSDVTLLPGMTAKVVGELQVPEEQKKDAFTLPNHAVLSDDHGNAMVWKVNRQNMTVSKVPVQIGELQSDQIEIHSEVLADGDWIATSGVHQLREGQEVRKFEL